MSVFHLNATVTYVDRIPAIGLTVKVREGTGAIYDLGVTDTLGVIDKDIRERRTISFVGHRRDDFRDQPRFTMIISDGRGHSFTRQPFGFLPFSSNQDLQVTLPKDFPNLKESMLAEQDLSGTADAKAPGRVFMVRKNGAVWVEAANGFARLQAAGAQQVEMTNDTIIHIASMSKPICATAVFAMLEDWQNIKNDFQRLTTNQALPMQTLRIRDRTEFHTISIPQVLAPLFGSRSKILEFRSRGYLNRFPQQSREWLIRFAENPGMMIINPFPIDPPGHLGLLSRVLESPRIPSVNDRFLPLIESKLRATATTVNGAAKFGAGIELITIGELLSHFGRLPDQLTDPSLPSQPGWAQAQTFQPSDGSRATYNLWPYLLMLLKQAATGDGSYNYRQDNYTVLGGIIESCTETTYNDYATNRLFFDSRFDKIRRYPVNGTSAWYYGGVRPGWFGGKPLPNYIDWSADGGWYCTARQMTDWLHALYTDQPVEQMLGPKPLLSTANRKKLFTEPGYFSPNGTDILPGGIIGYRHNGGTGGANGSVNGKLSILVGPGSAVHTAFWAANGSLPADFPFDNAMGHLVSHEAW